MKVIKAYSIDVETAQMLEDYHTDAYGVLGSRSKTVNDAIQWFLGGEEFSRAQLLSNIAGLQSALKQKEPSSVGLEGEKSWWRRLLGL